MEESLNDDFVKVMNKLKNKNEKIQYKIGLRPLNQNREIKKYNQSFSNDIFNPFSNFNKNNEKESFDFSKKSRKMIMQNKIKS